MAAPRCAIGGRYTYDRDDLSITIPPQYFWGSASSAPQKYRSNDILALHIFGMIAVNGCRSQAGARERGKLKSVLRFVVRTERPHYEPQKNQTSISGYL